MVMLAVPVWVSTAGTTRSGSARPITISFMLNRFRARVPGAISVTRHPTKTFSAIRSAIGSAADAARPRARRAASNRFQIQMRTSQALRLGCRTSQKSSACSGSPRSSAKPRPKAPAYNCPRPGTMESRKARAGDFFIAAISG